MVQETGEMKAHIKAEGESLKENLEELQTRVKDTLDWRVWYRNNTALALGSAAAGGLLVSLLFPKTRSIESQFMDIDEIKEFEPDRRESRRPKSNSGARFHEAVDNTMSAVLGVATDRFQDLMSRALPGFKEHYSEAQRKRFP